MYRRATLAILVLAPLTIAGCPAFLSDFQVSADAAADDASSAQEGSLGQPDDGGASGLDATLDAEDGGSGDSAASSVFDSGHDSGPSGCVTASCTGCIPVTQFPCCTAAGVCGCTLFVGTVCTPTTPGDSGSPDGSLCPSTCTAPGGCACSGACQTTHANGLGQNFYDCTAAGTYTATEAMAACVAFETSIGVSNCKDDTAGVCGSVGTTSGSTCHCWDYATSSPHPMHVTTGTWSGTTCTFTMSSSDPLWQ
ncbi:MAG: hypothetical protein ACLP1X_31495 [Polyangiaceae bacterium]